MKMIFNHLLIRMLDLAINRICILQRQCDIVSAWVNASKEERGRLSQQSEYVIGNLMRNKDAIQALLIALEEIRPIEISSGHGILVSTIKKTFKSSLGEYKKLMKFAKEVGFDEDIVSRLDKDQRLKIQQTNTTQEEEEN